MISNPIDGIFWKSLAHKYAKENRTEIDLLDVYFTMTYRNNSILGGVVMKTYNTVTDPIDVKMQQLGKKSDDK